MNALAVAENENAQLKDAIEKNNREISELKDTINKKTSEIDTWRENLLALQKRLRKYENFNEWEYIEHFEDWWAPRSQLMNGYIKPECGSLLDLGCGKMHIRKYLNEQIKYYGCDYKKRDEETIVCDLAKGEFPSISVDTIFIAGVLEYLNNWRDVLKKCSDQCSQIVMSYCTIDVAPQRNPVWVNCATHQEIVDEMLKNGFKLIDSTTWAETNEVFNFEKINT